MKSLKEQTQAKVEMGRKANPDFMKGVDDVVSQAKAFKEGKDALEVSKTAPSFTLPNANGDLISSEDLLKEGAIIVTFYRGSWCPYCNLQLKALQSKIKEIHSLGAQLIAISPEVPDESFSKSEIANMDFHVLSDQDAKVASTYGVAWKVPDFLIDHMKKDRNLDLEEINNGNANIIPIPATYVISKEGIVTWRYLDLDYRTRAEPDDIIEELKKLQN